MLVCFINLAYPFAFSNDMVAVHTEIRMVRGTRNLAIWLYFMTRFSKRYENRRTQLCYTIQLCLFPLDNCITSVPTFLSELLLSDTREIYETVIRSTRRACMNVNLTNLSKFKSEGFCVYCLYACQSGPRVRK